MAVFSIEFARGQLQGPDYDDYNVGVSTPCNDDAQPRRVRFDDNINGDFVVGWDYNSPSGSPATTIRIEEYTDEMIWREISNGIDTPVPGFVPSQLRDNSTGNLLTYPYNMNISDLNQLSVVPNSLELVCNESSKYTTIRNRTITYYIFDANGNGGPMRKAMFTNTQQ